MYCPFHNTQPHSIRRASYKPASLLRQSWAQTGRCSMSRLVSECPPPEHACHASTTDEHIIILTILKHTAPDACAAPAMHSYPPAVACLLPVTCCCYSLVWSHYTVVCTRVGTYQTRFLRSTTPHSRCPVNGNWSKAAHRTISWLSASAPLSGTSSSRFATSVSGLQEMYTICTEAHRASCASCCVCRVGCGVCDR